MESAHCGAEKKKSASALPGEEIAETRRTGSWGVQEAMYRKLKTFDCVSCHFSRTERQARPPGGHPANVPTLLVCRNPASRERKDTTVAAFFGKQESFVKSPFWCAREN